MVTGVPGAGPPEPVRAPHGKPPRLDVVTSADHAARQVDTTVSTAPPESRRRRNLPATVISPRSASAGIRETGDPSVPAATHDSGVKRPAPGGMDPHRVKALLAGIVPTSKVHPPDDSAISPATLDHAKSLPSAGAEPVVTVPAPKQIVDHLAISTVSALAKHALFAVADVVVPGAGHTISFALTGLSWFKVLDGVVKGDGLRLVATIQTQSGITIDLGTTIGAQRSTPLLEMDFSADPLAGEPAVDFDVEPGVHVSAATTQTVRDDAAIYRLPEPIMSVAVVAPVQKVLSAGNRLSAQSVVDYAERLSASNPRYLRRRTWDGSIVFASSDGTLVVVVRTRRGVSPVITELALRDEDPTSDGSSMT